MLQEYFEIVHRFHTHRNNEGIRKVTELQMKMLFDKAPQRMKVAIAKFVGKNFGPPKTKTG